MRAMPAECEVLLRAAHRSPDAEALARIDALTHGSFDWERCLALVRYHGMTPLLVRALSQGDTPACSPEIWNQLIAETRALAIENLSATAELLAIMKDLEAAAIEAITLKGPVAGLALYGDVASRPFLDLDLLIAPEDRDRTVECLAARGYRPDLDLSPAGWRRHLRRYIEMVCVHSQTGVVIDLHWALVDPRYRYATALAGCDARAISFHVGDRRIRTLCPEDTLVYFLLHAARHQWTGLRSLVDLKLLIEAHDDLDWDAVARAVARAPGSQRVIAVGLRLIELLFSASMKGPAAKWIADDARADELARESFRSLTSGEIPLAPRRRWPWSLRLNRSLSPHDRLLHAYDYLLSPTSHEWMAVPLPEWLAWLYPAIRIARLTEKHVWRNRWRPAKHTTSASTRQ